MIAAYRKLAPLVKAIVAQRYPSRDMNVLRRYGLVKQSGRVKLQMPNGTVSQFDFAVNDWACIAAYQTSDIYLADEAVADAVERWMAASEAYAAERKVRLASYNALIAGAATVEDLADVWPEALAVIPKAHLPLAFGPEQIAVVKRDQMERKTKADTPEQKAA